MIKKAGGKIFGAHLTSNEQKAMTMEINRQIAESMRTNTLAIDALILWELHEQLGFGAKRLERFYHRFASAYENLFRQYEMGTDDLSWLMIHKLEDYGIPIQQWYEQTLEERSK